MLIHIVTLVHLFVIVQINDIVKASPIEACDASALRSTLATLATTLAAQTQSGSVPTRPGAV